jgi:hypothetical protein
MSEKFDASWFDLSNYDGLVELDLAGWEHQLAVRCYQRCKNDPLTTE